MKKRTIVSVVAMIGGMTPKRSRKIGLNVITVKHGLAPVANPRALIMMTIFFVVNVQ